jgi:hypothetical protein
MKPWKENRKQNKKTRSALSGGPNVKGDGGGGELGKRAASSDFVQWGLFCCVLMLRGLFSFSLFFTSIVLFLLGQEKPREETVEKCSCWSNSMDWSNVSGKERHKTTAKAPLQEQCEVFWKRLVSTTRTMVFTV